VRVGSAGGFGHPKRGVEAAEMWLARLGAAAGGLSVLLPEAYGGAGLGLSAACAVLEEIHRSGCNGAACHAQMYTMGTLLRHGSEAHKQKYLPAIASGGMIMKYRPTSIVKPSVVFVTMCVW